MNTSPHPFPIKYPPQNTTLRGEVVPLADGGVLFINVQGTADAASDARLALTSWTVVERGLTYAATRNPPLPSGTPTALCGWRLRGRRFPTARLGAEANVMTRKKSGSYGPCKGLLTSLRVLQALVPLRDLRKSQDFVATDFFSCHERAGTRAGGECLPPGLQGNGFFRI